MPNTDEILNQNYSKLSKNDLDPIWKSVIDLDYANIQMKFAPETSKHCNFAITGDKTNRNYRFLKGFHGQADIPTILQKKTDETLGHQTPVWVDHIIVVRRGIKVTTNPEIRNSPTKTRKRRLQSQQKAIKVLPKRDSMAGTHHLTRWYQIEQKKTEAINKLNPPTNTKILKFFLGAFKKFWPKSYQTYSEMNKMRMYGRTKHRFQHLRKELV